MLVFNNFTIPIHHVSDVSLLLSLSIMQATIRPPLATPNRGQLLCCDGLKIIRRPWPRPAISWYDQWQHDRLWQCRMEGVKIHWTVTAWTPAPDWSLTPEAESPDVCVPAPTEQWAGAVQLITGCHGEHGSSSLPQNVKSANHYAAVQYKNWCNSRITVICTFLIIRNIFHI